MRLKAAGSIVGGMAVILLILAGDVCAQGLNAESFQNWNFLGMGARARGMGGAFLGVSDDGSAGTWNPAGLILNEGVFISANYSYSRVSLGLDNTPIGPMDLGTRDRSASDNLSALTSASFVAPLTLREHEFYLTAYYHRVQDAYAKSEVHTDDIDSTVRPIEFGTPFTSLSSLGGNVAFIGAGFGTAITPKLFFGGSLNIVTGDGSENHLLTLDSARFSAENPAPDAIDTVLWRDRSELDYSGLNFTLGMMYRTDRWSAGAVFTPGWTLTKNNDYLGQRITIVDRVPSQPLGIVPGPDGTDTEIKMPYSLGIGGAYFASENLLFAADYQFRAFKREGEYQFQDDPLDPNAPLETAYNKWYNLHQIRVGVEYLKEFDWGLVPVRVGVRNDPLLIGDQLNAVSNYEQRAGQSSRSTNKSPRDDYFLPLTSPGATDSQIQAITFTFGSGVHWSQIHLDFAFEFMGYQYDEMGQIRLTRFCDGCDANVQSNRIDDEWGVRFVDQYGSYSRVYEDNRVRFSLNFTGYF